MTRGIRDPSEALRPRIIAIPRPMPRSVRPTPVSVAPIPQQTPKPAIPNNVVVEVDA